LAEEQRKGGLDDIAPLCGAGFKRHKSEKVINEKSATKCKLNNGFITSSDRDYSWRVAPQHCLLPLHPVIKCKAISGLTKKCKFESGLLTKKCKLFSGRVNKIEKADNVGDY